MDSAHFKELTSTSPPGPSALEQLASESSSSPPNLKGKGNIAELRKRKDIEVLLDFHFYRKEIVHLILTAFLTHLPLQGHQNLKRLLLAEEAATGADGLRVIAKDLERKVLLPLKLAHYPKLVVETTVPIGLRNTILPRDGYRCVLSHTVEPRAPRKLDLAPPDRDIYPYAPPSKDIFLARIMPSMWLKEMQEGQALGGKGEEKEKENGGESGGEKPDLIELCFPGLRAKCAPGEADQPGNLLSVVERWGKLIGSFAVGFEEMEKPGSYYVCTFNAFDRIQADFAKERPGIYPLDFLTKGNTVTFDANGTDVPLPDRELLEMHVSIGKILEQSGTWEQIYEALESWMANGKDSQGTMLEGLNREMDKRALH